jgi:hypothetical protein
MFMEEFRETMNRPDTFVKLSLLENRHIDGNTNSEATIETHFHMQDLKSIVGRLVEHKSGGVMLQLQLRYTTCDKQVNYWPLDSGELSRVVESLVTDNFKKVSLITKTKIFGLKNGRAFKAAVLPPKRAIEQVNVHHNRQKNTPVNITAPFLQALKITTSEGRPKVGMSDKLRQVQKFVEILSNLVDRSNLSQEQKQSLHVTDMGSGMAYLTFALHDFLSQRFTNIKTVGVEARESLVIQTQKIANDLGYNGLSFTKSTITDYSRTGVDKETDSNKRLDVLVALHACDTATDDAIYFGIEKQAAIIVVSPCCHKEARKHIDRAFSSSTSMGREDEEKKEEVNPLADLLRHNIFRERESEMVTDAIRALCLEISGYETSVLEFVGGEHTAKNVMLCAIKRSGASTNLDDKVQSLKRRLYTLMSTFGIKTLKLPLLLGYSLPETELQKGNSKGGEIGSAFALPLKPLAIRRNKSKSA